MDFSKLTTGDKVMGGGAIGLVIFTFFPWFSYHGYDGGTGWDVGFFTAKLPFLIALVLIAYLVVTKLVDTVTLPELPVPYNLAALGLAGLAGLLVLIRLLIGYKVDIPFGGSISLDRSFGLFLATIAALAMAGGAFLKFKEEGGELPTKGGSAGPGEGGSATPF